MLEGIEQLLGKLLLEEQGIFVLVVLALWIRGDLRADIGHQREADLVFLVVPLHAAQEMELAVQVVELVETVVESGEHVPVVVELVVALEAGDQHGFGIAKGVGVRVEEVARRRHDLVADRGGEMAQLHGQIVVAHLR